ncbi:MAG: hypothetical protein MR210_03335 [Erysipelotrichaceae bacterium]|nr:hypothetical protein [Erysipelotrichaceae bacterium]MDY5251142.1 hypothetical protein [Erysipelotrichaceae bacterium]
MQIGIIYASQSGSTKKLADALGEALNIQPIDIAKPHVLGQCDLLFVGCGTYDDVPSDLMINYINNIPANTIKGAVIFMTHTSGRDNTRLLVNSLTSKGIEVFEKHYICPCKRWFFQGKRPNEHDIQRIKKFGIKIVKALEG